MMIKNYIENILCYIESIYEEFKENLDCQECLCKLKDESYFYSNHIPDYNKLYVQQLYLLRYAYAYIYEYMEMYSYIYKYLYENHFSYIIYGKTLSIGSGAGLDLYGLGLYLYLYDYNNVRFYRNLIYIGVDVVDWYYRPDRIFKVNFDFRKKDLNDIFNNKKIYSRIIIFPKSIGEIDNEILIKLPEAIISNRIYIMISFANNEDRKKLDILIDSFDRYGFKSNILFNRNKVSKENKKELSSLLPNYIYPQYIKEIISELNINFCKNIDCCNSVKICNDNLNRYPTTSDINFNYSIVEIIKEHKR